MARDQMLSVALRGDLRRELAAEARLVRRATLEALREATPELRDELRALTSQHLGTRVGRRWRSRVFPVRRGRSEMAGLVFPAGRDRLRGLLSALEFGAVIRARGGRYLAIPTQFALAGRGQRMTPADLQESFVQRSRNGTLIIFAPVREAARMRRGQVERLAVANNRILGNGRRKRTEKALEARAVPMFILKKFVRMPGGQLNTQRLVDQAGDRLPARLVAKMRELDHAERA